ncbi:MAG: DUF1599 domain-containing protein [Muribaculaceae bacterium]|nr:DUF1599 domain-containing protein [Muribaculaceae bacterium]MDE5968788.1 DUF1599 domain-containing protein [Muribaculaceae bacterium]
MDSTTQQFDKAIATCRNIFIDKLNDYGASWRIMRPSSVTDQLLIKANRIRSLEVKGNAMINEGTFGEFVALVNYGIIALIQINKGWADRKDLSVEEATSLYDSLMGETRALMLKKNHDYDEIWRKMRVSSYTDIILTKLMRIKEIEDNDGSTKISEGVDSNVMDIINYAMFAIIKEQEKQATA